MKKLLSAIVIFTALAGQPQKAQSAEIVGIIVGGSVSTMLIVGITVAVGGGLRKTDYQDAALVVATQDLSLMTPALEEIVEKVRAHDPQLAELSELEILEAIVSENL